MRAVLLVPLWLFLAGFASAQPILLVCNHTFDKTGFSDTPKPLTDSFSVELEIVGADVSGRSKDCETLTGKATDLEISIICETTVGSTYRWDIDRISGYLWTNVDFGSSGRAVWEGICRVVPAKLF